MFKKKSNPPNKQMEDYYKQAKTWAYDQFDAITVSRNRYRIAFLVAMLLCTGLVLCIIVMLPLKQLVPVVVYTDKAGLSYVELPSLKANLVPNEAQAKAEINRFVNYFEGFDAASFDERSQLVGLMSLPLVFNQYKENAQVLVQKIATKGTRKIEIEQISLLSSKRAVVVFATLDNFFGSNAIDKHYYQVYLTYHYNGFPEDRTAQLLNYDGFTVDTYLKTSLQTPQS